MIKKLSTFRKKRIIQQIIFYTQSIIGMLTSHYVPGKVFWLWVAISLYIGHIINLKNYKR